MRCLDLAVRASAAGRILSTTLAASVLVLAACSPAGQATPTSSAAAGTPTPALSSPAATGPTIAPTTGQPRPGGRVIWGDFADVKTLNPVTATDAPSIEVISRIYTS
ncbi:MAG: hypothetical protein M3069_28800, partial [Chloroflexota bacterium]|nr:hypothetical protein [Chloroflexota bacterium]